MTDNYLEDTILLTFSCFIYLKMKVVRWLLEMFDSVTLVHKLSIFVSHFDVPTSSSMSKESRKYMYWTYMITHLDNY